MTRTSRIIVGSIPVIVAILLIIPLFTTQHVPPITLLPTDVIELEYIQRNIIVSFGVVEREQAIESHVLEIDNSGRAVLFVTSDQDTKEYGAQIDPDSLHRLRALIKETGFMKIIPVTFVPVDRPNSYVLYTLQVTLNGTQKNIRWFASDTVDYFIPPIIVMIQEDLDSIRSKLK